MCYPICLDVKGRKCVVVGGGKVAERKVQSLLDCEAKILIISPEVSTGLAELAKKGAVEHLRRRFQSGDLQDAFLAIAASDEKETNLCVHQEAAGKKVLVNVADQPELCNFFLPSVLRRGDFQIAVSTAGKAPGLARRVREQLELEFGPEYGSYTEVLGMVRKSLRAKVAEPGARGRLLEKALEMDLLDSLRKGKEVSASEVVESLLDQV